MIISSAVVLTIWIWNIEQRKQEDARLMEIYFDVNNESKSGKWIPLDKDTGLQHSSSNSINSQPLIYPVN